MTSDFSALSQLNASIVVLDAAGRIVWANDRWIASSREGGLDIDWIGMNYIDALKRAKVEDCQFIQRVKNGLSSVLEGKRDEFQYEYNCEIPGVPVRWYIATVQRPAAANGNVIVSHIDVTKLHRIAVDAENENAIYKAAFDEASMGMLLIGLDRRILKANRMALEQFGYAENELLGQPSRIIYASDRDYVQVGEALARALQNLRAEPRVITLQRKNGSSFLGFCSGSVLRDRDGRPACAIGAIQDMTREREREDILSRSRRLEALGRLTGGVAHDFNNLLTIINGNLALLKGKIAGANAGTGSIGYIETAEHAAHLAADLTRKLTAFAGRGALRTQTTQVCPLLRNVVSLLQRTIGEGIALKCECADDVWDVSIDRGELENALINLAVNARDAIRDKGYGSIKFTARNVHFEAGNQNTLLLPPGRYVSLVIEDTGQGMSPDVKSRAFDPFFTTKKERGSVGLGLATVHGFVVQSKGHISIESEEGSGTRVKMIFPALDISSAAAQGAGQDDTARSIAGKTILVVEDNPGVRHIVSEMIASLGYRVLEAGNAAEALDRVAASGDIDLVFTDVVMPGPSGGELALRLRDIRPYLPVLMTTGMRGESDNVPGKCLPKPYTIDELADALKSELRAANAKSTHAAT